MQGQEEKEDGFFTLSFLKSPLSLLRRLFPAPLKVEAAPFLYEMEGDVISS